MEAPRWHDNRIWFSDFYAHEVVSANEDGTDVRVEAVVPNRPSGLGWLPDGRMLVVSMRDRKLLRLDRDGLKEHGDMSKLAPFDCNDMVVDKEGRAYVGNFGFDLHANEKPRGTTLVRVAPDGSARIVAEAPMVPNGAVIPPDGTALIGGASFGGRLTAFAIAVDGALQNRRV